MSYLINDAAYDWLDELGTRSFKELPSSVKTVKYDLFTKESFVILKRCPGCKKKTNYRNTKRFRVNANGNKLDVWLIYQCENCKHTQNITIFERKKPALISVDEYKLFLANDEKLAENYGRNLHFFRENRASVDLKNISYCIEKTKNETDEFVCGRAGKIIINNPYNLKIRPEKLVADILGESASQIKKQMQNSEIIIEETYGKYVITVQER